MASYRLVKNVLEYPAGYIIEVTNGMGWLGFNSTFGWEIPLFILKQNPDFFVRI